MSNSGVTGDATKLARLLAKLAAAARGDLTKAIRSELAKRTRDELRSAFNAGRSPEGAPWASKRDGSAATLVRSGALRSGFDVVPTETGVSVTNSTPYAQVHQRGGRLRRARKKHGKRRLFGGGRAGKIPARPMVPTARWGPAATAHMRLAASRVVHRFFHGS
ncbi:MAG: phage virion morphogenesis protein [Polyangiales bacterium]